MQWVAITPNEHGDWLNKRSELFKTLHPTWSPKRSSIRKQKVFLRFNLAVW